MFRYFLEKQFLDTEKNISPAGKSDRQIYVVKGFCWGRSINYFCHFLSVKYFVTVILYLQCFFPSSFCHVLRFLSSSFSHGSTFVADDLIEAHFLLVSISYLSVRTHGNKNNGKYAVFVSLYPFYLYLNGFSMS